MPLLLSHHALRRGYHKTRDLMSKGSEANFLRFARLQPQLARLFLKQLNVLGDRVRSVVWPAGLCDLQNRQNVAELLADPVRMAGMINEKGALDLRGIGLKRVAQTIDLSPKALARSATLEEYQEVLGIARPLLESDHELGNLFLFKALLRARIDLYAAGARRSAAIQRGEELDLAKDILRVKNFLDHLAANFPFGRTGQRQKIKDDLAIASYLLDIGNNTAANTKMVGLFNYIAKILSSDLASRLSRSSRARGWKVRYIGKGSWEVATTGYRRSEAGLMRKESRVQHVRTPELLSMLDHVISSIQDERSINEEYLTELAEVRRELPEGWGRLYEVALRFTRYEDLKKGKAAVELEGALQLIQILSGQSLRLADSLIALAAGDIEFRQTDLDGQLARFQALLPEVEEKFGRELRIFAISVCNATNCSVAVQDVDYYEKLDDRLGAYLGTFLKGELREPWLRRVKSRVVGIKKHLRKVRAEVQRRQHFVELTLGMREQYAIDRGQIWQSGLSNGERLAAIGELRQNILATVRANLNVINEINEQIVAELRKAAAFILQVNLDHLNRHGEVQDKEAFLAEQTAFLSGFDVMLRDRVEVIDSGAASLGQVWRQDAQLLGLNFRELS